MSQDYVLRWSNCERTIVCVEFGDIASDSYVWITLHVDVILERDELVKVSVERQSCCLVDVLDKYPQRMRNPKSQSLMLDG